ncbi:TAP42-like protein [Stachybotrys elegans]|uniref:TAP42-like protein n=1 Tax=Stachybotrys elegans TaxID=80388 RepID=A0A8K0T1G6_9HYPO|nr:TAP42-like protein [Stachybotrys elegans]
MASDETQPESLQSVFDAAEEKRRSLSSTYEATSPNYRADLDAALGLYARVERLIGAADLFSPNEGLEDLPTSALPYLLVRYHVAELVQKMPNLSPQQRVAVLGRARAEYEGFLALLEGYGLLPPPYDRLLERYRDDPERFAAGAGAGADPAARRNAKIADYKAEKQLKLKLDALRSNPRYLEHGDEEIVRELHLTSVTFAAHSTFQALDSLNRELPLLAQAPSPLAPAPTEDPSTAGDTRLDQPLRRLQSVFGQQGGPLLSQGGRPLQPFTLVGSRADLARGVFRPGHNLPTMSIDEYLEEERRQGNILQGGVEPKTVVDEDDMEAMDRETYKARQWDDFKDDNPRGSGNTMNMG